jgi:hypothetical protein
MRRRSRVLERDGGMEYDGDLVHGSWCLAFQAVKMGLGFIAYMVNDPVVG